MGALSGGQRPNLFSQLRGVPPAEVLSARGLDLRGSTFPCPACDGRDAQGRPSGRFNREGAWFCVRMSCPSKGRSGEPGRAGSALNLLAWLELGEIPATWSSDALDRLRASAERAGLVEPAGLVESDRERRERRERRDELRARASVQRAPPAEVRALWAASKPLLRSTTPDHDSPGHRWLQGVLGVAPCMVQQNFQRSTFYNDLARWSPPAGPRWPAWARTGSPRGLRPWPDLGYRILFPWFDAAGDLAGLTARHLDPRARREDKARRPYQTDSRGLVLADTVAQLMLRAGPADELWPYDEPGNEAALQVWIVEGETDWLSLAAHIEAAHHRRRLPRDERHEVAPARFVPAVLGISAGGWTREIAERIPATVAGEPVKITIATDPDPTGDDYAQRIRESFEGLPPRPIERWLSPPDPATGRRPDVREWLLPSFAMLNDGGVL